MYIRKFVLQMAIDVYPGGVFPGVGCFRGGHLDVNGEPGSTWPKT